MDDGWDGKWDYSVDGNALITTLDIGNNFVVNAQIGNLEGVFLGCLLYKTHA